MRNDWGCFGRGGGGIKEVASDSSDTGHYTDQPLLPAAPSASRCRRAGQLARAICVPSGRRLPAARRRWPKITGPQVGRGAAVGQLCSPAALTHPLSAGRAARREQNTGKPCPCRPGCAARRGAARTPAGAGRRAPLSPAPYACRTARGACKLRRAANRIGFISSAADRGAVT